MPEPEAVTIKGNEIRSQMAMENQGSPRFQALDQQLQGLYRQASGEAAPAAAGEAVVSPPPEEPPPPQGLAHAAPPERSIGLVDPHAGPTLADLDAAPLPPGLDPAKNQVINRLAEQEGVMGYVLEGRRVISGAASGPPVDAVTAERQLHQRWGSTFPSKLEAARLAFDALPSAVRVDYLARVGEALVDPSTPGGERRLKEKYRQWADR